jgi:hypothetical protein
MKKQKHPQRIETVIQLKDGATYCKHWLYFRTALPLDVDLGSNLKWKKIAQKFSTFPKKQETSAVKS